MNWPFLLVSDRWWNPCADVQRLNPGLTSPRISSCRDFPILEYCYFKPNADTHQWSFKGKCCLIQIDQYFSFLLHMQVLIFRLIKNFISNNHLNDYLINISMLYLNSNISCIFQLTIFSSFYLVHWHCLLKHIRLWTNQKKGC